MNFHKKAIPFGITFLLFGSGGIIFIVGMALQSSALLYSSAGVSSAGILTSVWLCTCCNKAQPIVFEAPQPLRLYKDPGMKRNKSDTDLQLIGSAKNTMDDGAATQVEV